MEKDALKALDISNKKIKLIICDVVLDEIQNEIPERWEVVKFKKSLHENSDELRNVLQDEINKSENFDIIILGYGLCGKGVEGLFSNNAFLVIPRCEDCISMLLGSDIERKKQIDINPGTYFLTRGYIGDGDNLIVPVSFQTKNKYDKETLEWIAKELLKNYSRLAFINTGNYDPSESIETAKREAEKYNLEFEEIKGSNELLSKITCGNWDGQFLIIEPGIRIRTDMFLNPAN